MYARDGALESGVLSAGEVLLRIGHGEVREHALHFHVGTVAPARKQIVQFHLATRADAGHAGIHLEVGAGEMTVKNLTCTQESSLDVGMGKLTIDGGSLDGKNEVSCGMGVAEVAVSRPADYGYALESGMGSVTIDDYSHSGMGVELEVNRSAATFYDIECGMGEVTITFN